MRFYYAKPGNRERQNVATLARYHASHVPHPGHDLLCQLCGESFRGRSDRKFCSERCRNHAVTRRRRAKIRAVESGPYTLADLRDRDGDDCSLCALPIDFTIRYPMTGCWTFDHVLPLSLGGDDTISNIALAHMGCNTRKGGSNRLRGMA